MSITSENPDDVLLWPDDFWCFRKEFSKGFLRKDDYRVISRDSDEWLNYTLESRAHSR
jgi:hypothetical protein